MEIKWRCNIWLDSRLALPSGLLNQKRLFATLILDVENIWPFSIDLSEREREEFIFIYWWNITLLHVIYLIKGLIIYSNSSRITNLATWNWEGATITWKIENGPRMDFWSLKKVSKTLPVKICRTVWSALSRTVRYCAVRTLLTKMTKKTSMSQKA